jgi:hypothetical protein
LLLRLHLGISLPLPCRVEQLLILGLHYLTSQDSIPLLDDQVDVVLALEVLPTLDLFYLAPKSVSQGILQRTCCSLSIVFAFSIKNLDDLAIEILITLTLLLEVR